MIIKNKKELQEHFDATPTLIEFREALGDEWPEVRKEMLKQVWCTELRPPAYGARIGRHG
jgi:hypothetical protein